jgi:hypothetical protein
MEYQTRVFLCFRKDARGNRFHRVVMGRKPCIHIRQLGQSPAPSNVVINRVITPSFNVNRFLPLPRPPGIEGE